MICRNCGAGLEADRIDTSLGVITCSHCGSLHDIPGNSVASAASNEASAPKAKPVRLEVSLPDKFKVQRGAGSLQVTWPTGGIFPGFVLSIVAGAFAYVALTSELVFLLIASVGLFYFAAVQAFNKRRIRVDGARLEVTEGPLPTPGSRKINASDIVQLYTTEHKSQTQAGKGGIQSANQRVNSRKHYRLSAKTQNNGSIKVLSGLGDPRQALWLEQEIEGLLGVVDKRIAGEHVL